VSDLDKLSNIPSPSFFILKAAVEREKAVQTIDVHREFNNCVVTFWVMSQLLKRAMHLTQVATISCVHDFSVIS